MQKILPKRQRKKRIRQAQEGQRWENKSKRNACFFYAIFLLFKRFLILCSTTCCILSLAACKYLRGSKFCGFSVREPLTAAVNAMRKSVSMFILTTLCFVVAMYVNFSS